MCVSSMLSARNRNARRAKTLCSTCHPSTSCMWPWRRVTLTSLWLTRSRCVRCTSVGRCACVRASYAYVRVRQALRLGEDQDGDALTTAVELGAQLAVPLHKYGASPFAKDVFVEMDYMEVGREGRGAQRRSSSHLPKSFSPSLALRSPSSPP